MLSGDKTPDTLASLRRKVRKPATGAPARPTQSDLFAAFEAPAPEEKAAPAGTPAPPPTVVSASEGPAQQQPPEPARTTRAVAPVAAAAPNSDPSARRIWSVRALVTSVREHVERGFTDLWVEGEISNCRPAPSGHIYFTLKDGDAQLPIVLFRRQAQLLRFRPADGLAVLVRGRISVYESRGQLQLIAETMEPRGSGALQLAFEQLKQRLAAEGLFDPARKRPLPAFPRCLGIVTSPTGAVIRDIVTVVRRRHARLDLLIYPAAMQGVNCPGSVAAGIRWFNANPGRVDLIVLARGGGSIEDLSGFNDEALARAIAASELPIVSAIGHETDFTIADFVADLRAPTPSAAAELVTAAQHRIEERVAALATRVVRAARYQLLHLRQRYQRLSADHVLNRLRDAVHRRQQRIDDLSYRLESAASRRLQTTARRLASLEARLQRQAPTVRLAASQRRLAGLESRLQRQVPTIRLAVAQHRLAQASVAFKRSASSIALKRSARLQQLTARLEALSPLAVLNRGYALVYLQNDNPQGERGETLLRSAAEVQPGRKIRVRLATGSLLAQVTEAQVPASQSPQNPAPEPQASESNSPESHS
jgi:exodeoxyribonuclease VII large subunit